MKNTEDTLCGYTYDQLFRMLMDGAVDVECEKCGAIHRVEPDAQAYPCAECGAAGSVTSPLVRLGLI